MDLCCTRYFLAVCQHGSFTAAAKVCGVSQPSVTTGVRRLERQLGAELFERKHPVKLTAFGEDMHPLLEAIQAATDRLRDALEERKRRKTSDNACNLFET